MGDRRPQLEIWTLAIGSLLVWSSLSHGEESGKWERPSRMQLADDFQTRRSPVVAQHGIVSTSHPLASQAGLAVLKQGGNAVDAAIAANAVLGVVEPMSCGVGGDLFVIYWDNKTQKLYGLNASGRSPQAINRSVFEQEKLRYIPLQGPLPWSVPGCVRGWFDLHERFGEVPMPQLLAPAIEHAERGFPVSPVIAGYWKNAQGSLSRRPDSAKTFLINGRSPRAGEIFKNPNLAATYRLLAKNGADAFYKGDIAQRIVAFSEAQGGYFSLKDFVDHHSEWVEPVSTTYRGVEVWELPPNGQGIAALEMLNVLEGYDLAALGPRHPQYLHLLTEAKKLAFADRARFYSDPDFGQPPVKQLISKTYADKQRQRINLDRAAMDAPAGDPQLMHGDTVYLTVVDKDRNCCSLIQSNYYGFGSQMTPGDLGFALQNRGALFALDDEHPNRLEPGKRPFHTIIPAMATREGRPWFCFGVMGGDMQPQGHVQVLINLIDFDMNVQQAGEAARLRHEGSAQPTGRAAKDDGGTVLLEWRFGDEIVEAMRQKGHQVRRSAPGAGGFGGYQGILIDWDQGVLHGGAESRNDGAAVGY